MKAVIKSKGTASPVTDKVIRLNIMLYLIINVQDNCLVAQYLFSRFY